MSSIVVRVVLASTAVFVLLLPLWVDSCAGKDGVRPRSSGGDGVGDVLGAGT